MFLIIFQLARLRDFLITHPRSVYYFYDFLYLSPRRHLLFGTFLVPNF